MAGRRDSAGVMVWIDQADVAEIDRRAATKKISRAEMVRRMLKWALRAAAKEEPGA